MQQQQKLGKSCSHEENSLSEGHVVLSGHLSLCTALTARRRKRRERTVMTERMTVVEWKECEVVAEEVGRQAPPATVT